jgi:hypothetical protein
MSSRRLAVRASDRIHSVGAPHVIRTSGQEWSGSDAHDAPAFAIAAMMVKPGCFGRAASGCLEQTPSAGGSRSIGDPRHFSAVGRRRQVRPPRRHVRQHRTRPRPPLLRRWERDASLEVRRGNTVIIALYDDHGRLHGDGRVRMERDVIDRWWNARHDGSTALVMAPSNAVVERLNEKMQRRRVAAGELRQGGPNGESGINSLHVGDEIVTGRNDRSLRSDQGEMVKNRAAWTITASSRAAPSSRGA